MTAREIGWVVLLLAAFGLPAWATRDTSWGWVSAFAGAGLVLWLGESYDATTDRKLWNLTPDSRQRWRRAGWVALIGGIAAVVVLKVVVSLG